MAPELLASFLLVSFVCGNLGATETTNKCVQQEALASSCNPLDVLLAGRNAKLQPPVAKKAYKVFNYAFGQDRFDQWFGLRDDNRTNPEVLDLLTKENEYTAAIMASGKGLTRQILAELKSRIPPQEQSLPQRAGHFWYYSRRHPGQQYPIHCRRPLPHGAGPPSENDTMDTSMREQIIFDENKEAAQHDYFDLGGIEVTLDHRFLAFGLDTSGNEMYDIYVQEIETGNRTPVNLEGVAAGNIVWANDNRTLFYTTKTLDSKRPNKVWRYELGQDPDEAMMVYEEPDESFYLGLSRTRSDDYLVLSGHSEITRYLLTLPADEPQGEWESLAPKVIGRRSYVIHRGLWFYIMAADNAKDTLNGELLAVPVNDPKRSHVLLPHDREVQLDDMTISQDHLVLLLRRDGQVKPYAYTLSEDVPGVAPELGPAMLMDVSPSDDGQLRLGNQGPFESNILRLSYTDLRTPRVTVDINLATGNKVIKHIQKVLGGYHAEDYETKRIWALAKDGARVPMSVVYRPSALCAGPNRVLMYAYGAYGSPEDAAFDRSLVSLLDRGFIYVLAHVRGGGDLGRYWYEDGKLLKKKNTFYDFIACAEHLIQLNYTRPDLLTIWGASAGGLTMGAVITMRPELFRAAILDVPFVDVISTMSDVSLPLTTLEFEEWGNPSANKTSYLYMLSYSPIDNVKAQQAYPHMFVTAGLNDNRVSYWEPAKFVQAVRDLSSNNPLVLFKTNMGAGHFGVTGIYDALEEEALKLTFLLLITCAAPPGGTARYQQCVPCTLIVVTVLALLAAISAISGWQLILKKQAKGKGPRPLLKGARRANGGVPGAPRASESERDVLMGRLS